MNELLVHANKEEDLSYAIQNWQELCSEILPGMLVGFRIAKKVFCAVPNESVLKCENAIYRLIQRCCSIWFDIELKDEDKLKVCRLICWDEANSTIIEYIASNSLINDERKKPLTQKVLIEQLFKLYDSVCSDVRIIEELCDTDLTYNLDQIKSELDDLIFNYVN